MKHRKKVAISLMAAAVLSAAALSGPRLTAEAGWVELTVTDSSGNHKEYAYTDSQGKYVSGWVKSQGNWYYLEDIDFGNEVWSLAAHDSFLEIGAGKWYLFDENAIMETGWKHRAGNLYSNDEFGGHLMDWDGTSPYVPPERPIIGKYDNWYYFDESGAMATGWRYLGGKWYYFSECSKNVSSRTDSFLGTNNYGRMITGWLDYEGERYYLLPDGQMAVGTQTINGKRYTFNADGSLQTEKTELLPCPVVPKTTAGTASIQKDGSFSLRWMDRTQNPAPYKTTTWTNLVQIVDEGSVGLKADGTVVCFGYFGRVGSNSVTMNLTKRWKNIVDVDATGWNKGWGESTQIVGLQSNGRVLYADTFEHSLLSNYTDWTAAVYEWEDIVRVAIADAYPNADAIFGLRKDGTVAIVTKDPDKYAEVKTWADVEKLKGWTDSGS